MMKWILLLAAVSCAEPIAKRIVLPSGEKGYSIRCDNENINVCYEKAGDICHRGYVIQNANKEQGFESAGGSYVGPGIVPGTIVGSSSSSTRSTTEKGIMIVCKEPEVTEYERLQKEKKLAEEEEKADIAAMHQSRVVIGCMFAGVIVLTIVAASIRAY